MSKRQTYRDIVLAAVNASDRVQTAREIAESTGIGYVRTIFALNSLLNMEKIQRHGKKATAKWSRLTVQPAYNALNALELAFLRLRK